MLRIFTGFSMSIFTGVAAAAAAVAASSAAPELPINNTTVSLIGTAVAGLVFAALQLRKILSKSNLDVTKDRIEGDLLKTTLQERDEAKKDARQAWSSKNADSLELGQLRAENAFLREQLRMNRELVDNIRRGVQDVGQKVDTVKGRMEATEKRVSNSGLAPLGDQ